MPEYLAPGVYVEETSFRAKSIEGVGTSTTAFAGPTRKGPIAGTPELLTSFADFERIYGGLAELTLASKTNYVAHAVRNYFDNGGSRLYVSRAFLPAAGDSGVAYSQNIVNGAASGEQARFRARTPGDAGNGVVRPSITITPATMKSMASAPEGTLLRVGGSTLARDPAKIQGTAAGPFSLPDGGVLLLTVGGAPVSVAFHGAPVEIVSTDALEDPVALAAETSTLEVKIGGLPQTINLPAAPTPRADVVAAINRDLRGGYARLTEAGRLAIGTDVRGSAATLEVKANAALHLGDTTAAADPAANNVTDLARVSTSEIDALLEPAQVQATGPQLALATVAAGPSATLAVRSGAGSVHTILGLTPGAPVTGTAGSLLYVKRGSSYVDSNGATLNTTGLSDGDAPGGQADFLTLNLVVEDKDGNGIIYENMGFDRGHPRWVGNVLRQTPTRRIEQLENPYYLEIGEGVDALELFQGLFSRTEWQLSHGNDGAEPTQAAYEQALGGIAKLEDVAIVAAPGSSVYTDTAGIQGALISHAEARRAYRIAVLDTAPDLTPGGARDVRSRVDSKYAAIYYPWVVVSNPLFRPGLENVDREIKLPPSGFICGIYARSDVERGVFKAPANEVVRGALRFETDVSFGEQQMLNPIGLNCLRYFPGRGYRVWGARTASSDPEWKYVNVRRYFNYLEASVDRGTQWAVFEPNGERLWANIRETVGAFLYNEWISGALLGSSPKEAYFVRCDRSTMTQNDLDNGRLICLVGVAVLKPAEFVIFRIGQKTADSRS